MSEKQPSEAAKDAVLKYMMLPGEATPDALALGFDAFNATVVEQARAEERERITNWELGAYRDMKAENARLREALQTVSTACNYSRHWKGRPHEEWFDMPAFRVRLVSEDVRAALAPRTEAANAED